MREARVAERDHRARRIDGGASNADVLKVRAVVACRRHTVFAQPGGDIVRCSTKAGRQRVTALERIGRDVFEMVPELPRPDVVDGAELFRAVGVADDGDERDADRHDQGGDKAAHGNMMAHVNAPPIRKPRRRVQYEDGKRFLIAVRTPRVRSRPR